MAVELPVVDAASLGAWCEVHLGSPAGRELFRAGHLARVIGTRLADGREVVVRVRPAAPRIAACTQVQHRLFDSGYPCPQPLAGPAPLGEHEATAESYIAGGAALPGSGRAARRQQAERYAGQDLIYHDVPPALAEQARRRSRDQSDTPGRAPWPLAAWPAVPTRFVLCTKDRLFPPEFMREVVADRLGIVPDEIAAGHAVALSHPGELAGLLASYPAISR